MPQPTAVPAETVEKTNVVDPSKQKTTAEILKEKNDKQFTLDTEGIFGDDIIPVEGAGDKKEEETADEKKEETKEVPEKKIEEEKESSGSATSQKPPEEKSSLTGEAAEHEVRLQITSLETENTTLKKQLGELENVRATLKQIETEPLVFLNKNFPDIAKLVDPAEQRRNALKKEFGVDFVYNPQDAYSEGTDSYRYRVREEELRDKQLQQISAIQAERAQKERERVARLEKSKTEVMKRFNLDEAKFKTDIIEWGNNRSIDYNDIAVLRYFPDIIKKAIADAVAKNGGKKTTTEERPASVSTVTGEEGDKSLDHLKELHDVFGD